MRPVVLVVETWMMPGVVVWEVRRPERPANGHLVQEVGNGRKWCYLVSWVLFAVIVLEVTVLQFGPFLQLISSRLKKKWKNIFTI